jgi:hypothetical protein
MAKRIAAKKQGPPRGPPGFAADERAAMKQRAQELKAERPAALAPPTCREYAPIPDLLPALRAHRGETETSIQPRRARPWPASAVAESVPTTAGASSRESLTDKCSASASRRRTSSRELRKEG